MSKFQSFKDLEWNLMSAVARTALMQNCSLRTNIGSVQTFRGREELKAGCCRHGDGYHQLYMSIPMAPAAHHNTRKEHMKERKEPGKTDQIELWTTKISGNVVFRSDCLSSNWTRSCNAQLKLHWNRCVRQRVSTISSFGIVDVAGAPPKTALMDVM